MSTYLPLVRSGLAMMWRVQTPGVMLMSPDTGIVAEAGVGRIWTHLPHEPGCSDELVSYPSRQPTRSRVSYKFKRLQVWETGKVVGVEAETKVCGLLMKLRQVASNPFVNLSLVIEMGYRKFAIGLALCTWKCRPDIVFERGSLRRGASELLGLLCLLHTRLIWRTAGEEVFPEICDRKDGGRALKQLASRNDAKEEQRYLECLDEGGFVISVGRDYFRAFRCELLRIVTAGIASDGANFPAIELEKGAGYTATLSASSTNDSNGLAHFEV